VTPKGKSKLRIYFVESHPAIKVFGLGGIAIVIISFMIITIASHWVELAMDSVIQKKEDLYPTTTQAVALPDSSFLDEFAVWEPEYSDRDFIAARRLFCDRTGAAF